MTEPIEEEPQARRVKTVPLGGEDFTVTEFTEAQLLHLGRYAKILSRDGVSGEHKFDAMDRMFNVIHKCVDPSQLDRLIELEEDGVINLSDLTAFAEVFRGDRNPSPTPTVRRRGRPRKSA